jgi:predicted AlkP superfamily pyrophosphatase or phosphodiesterase
LTVNSRTKQTRSRTRVAAGLTFVAVVVTFAGWLFSRSSVPRAPHVVVVSIDGLRPEFYQSATYEAPTLNRLARAGFSFGALVPIFPTLTYPVHASIATGVSSESHGVVSNRIFDRTEGPTHRWYSKSDHLQSTPIWKVVKKSGQTVGIARWPVSAGADVDYLFPEVFHSPGFNFSKDWGLIESNATPGLIDEVLGKGSSVRFDSLESLDQLTTRIAKSIYQRHRPNLLMVHLVHLDSVQHMSGRDSSETRQALRKVDQQVAELIAAIDLEKTVVFVLGDHGFRNYRKKVHLNSLFERKGWLTQKDGGLDNWQVVAQPESGVSVVYRKDSAVDQQVLSLLRENAGGRYRVIDRAELDEKKAYPQALCAIEGINGYAMGSNLSGDLITEVAHTQGAHGQSPGSPDLHTGLFVYGAGVKQGGYQESASVLDIAPTLAQLLGVSLTNTEGQVLRVWK